MARPECAIRKYRAECDVWPHCAGPGDGSGWVCAAQPLHASPALVDALQNPPAPNDALRAAFERHSNEVESRD